MSHQQPEPVAHFERVIAELSRLLGARLDASDASINARFDRVERKVDDLNTVHAVQAGHTARLDGHDREISDIKRNLATGLEEVDRKLEGSSNKAALWISIVIAALSSIAAVALVLVDVLKP